MGVPDHILLKPDKFNEEEWQHMRMHAVYAYKLLSNITYVRERSISHIVITKNGMAPVTRADSKERKFRWRHAFLPLRMSTMR